MLIQFLLRLSARRPLRENLKKDEVGDNMNVVWFSLLIFLLFQIICIILGLCKVRMRTADADGGRRMQTADNYKIRKIRKDRSFSSFNLRTIACNLYPRGLLLIQK